MLFRLDNSIWIEKLINFNKMLKVMFFTIVSVTNADSYSYLRNLGGSSTGSSGGGSATTGWETE